MKIIKYFLFIFLILIIAGSIYIATQEGEFHIEESKLIAAPREMVFDEVNNFKNWEDWEPWAGEAEDLIVDYGEKTSGEGASYSWKSESMGKGEIITLETIPFSAIEQELHLNTSFAEAKSEVYWRFEEQESGTAVTWGMKGEQSFMEKLAFNLRKASFSEMIKPILQKGLEKMEHSILNKMEAYSINVDGVIQHGGGHYMYTTTASKVSQIDKRMRDMIDEVSQYMEKNNIEKSGNPFVLYNEWNEQNNTVIFSAGIFTPSKIITPAESEILTGKMPDQRVVRTTLKGDYKNLREAWDVTRSYIEENDLEEAENANAFEVYMTDPDEISNPANWITQLYIPLK